ncbi:MAG: dihydropteroate synthase, partial [Bacteroidales bacterium]|nr:dihydropteroate synthase [Bacteroidales bacterium]
MISLTISDKSGRSLSGQTIEAFVISILHARPLSIGLNCGLGAADLLPYLRRLSKAVRNASYISCHPNAGLPNAMGEYEDTPEVMAAQLHPYFEEHLVDIIGGCCGTTPAHISAIANLTKERNFVSSANIEENTENVVSLTKVDKQTNALVCCGLEPFIKEDGNFLSVGERCNVAGSRKFLRLIKEKNYDEAIEIARKQIETGAQVIDINMDDGLIEAKEEMSHFMRLIASEPEIAKVPLMLDSSHFDVIEEALKWVQGKCIVNSISLKEGEKIFLEHARTLRQFGAATVVMAFDEEGQATTFERKIAICQRAYNLLQEIDFPANDIIFDPNILTVATGMAEHMDYAIDYVRAAKWIHDNLPGSHVSGGLSNLSFAFRGNNFIREAMHSIFLEEATRNGMDMAIL